MLINPNSRMFDRVPDIFTSPFPGQDALADSAFIALMQRAAGAGQQVLGDAIISQAGAQAWNQATQMLWKTKATLVGDLLGDVWSKVASVIPGTGEIAGLLAEVPFGITSVPAQLLGAMASVAIDIALDAVSAVPVAGWIIGIEYKTLEAFKDHTLLEFHPHTGRTHQIRLHCQFLGCPIVGDSIYGRKSLTVDIDRHFLHAYRLKIVLPGEKEPRVFTAALPEELESVLTDLRS